MPFLSALRRWQPALPWRQGMAMPAVRLPFHATLCDGLCGVFPSDYSRLFMMTRSWQIAGPRTFDTTEIRYRGDWLWPTFCTAACSAVPAARMARPTVQCPQCARAGNHTGPGRITRAIFVASLAGCPTGSGCRRFQAAVAIARVMLRRPGDADRSLADSVWWFVTGW